MKSSFLQIYELSGFLLCRVEILTIFVCIFWETMTSKIHSEIVWPLRKSQESFFPKDFIWLWFPYIIELDVIWIDWQVVVGIVHIAKVNFPVQKAQRKSVRKSSPIPRVQSWADDASNGGGGLWSAVISGDMKSKCKSKNWQVLTEAGSYPQLPRKPIFFFIIFKLI